MIPIMTRYGVLDFEVKRGGYNAEEFCNFTRNTLLPVLSPGDVPVLDNFTTHHNDEFLQLCPRPSGHRATSAPFLLTRDDAGK
eukprot:2286248-Pyramimonas_sp.AAC.1